jgi:kinesin family protein C2/C3
MVEIYNETIVDLLRTDTRVLEIRSKGNKIILPGIVEMDVESLKDITKILKLGEKNRTTAATKMNSHR